MATTTPTAARDARGSEPLLPTYTDDADVEPMSERTPGHSKPAFGSGAHSNKIRDETTPAAPCASPPPSRRPAGVSSGLPIPPSLSHHRQPLPLAGNAGRRRHRLALVWSYAPDWFVLFCSSPFNPWRTLFQASMRTCESKHPLYADIQLAIAPYPHPHYSHYRYDINRLLIGFSVSASRTPSSTLLVVCSPVNSLTPVQVVLLSPRLYSRVLAGIRSH